MTAALVWIAFALAAIPSAIGAIPANALPVVIAAYLLTGCAVVGVRAHEFDWIEVLIGALWIVLLPIQLVMWLRWRRVRRRRMP